MSRRARVKPTAEAPPYSTEVSRSYSSRCTRIATPMTAQLVVISGRKMPRAAYRGGTIFLRNISTNCTSEAMTTMKTMVCR